MKIIGCDFHPGYQQIAMFDLVTGEMVEKALTHERKVLGILPPQSVGEFEQVIMVLTRVGIE
jgi:hypothetical protein